MADLDDSGSVTPISGTEPRDSGEQQEPPKEPIRGRHRSGLRRSVSDVALVMGIPETELTPRVQEALSIIMNEFDRLREELDRLQDHVAFLEKQADEDPVLPVLNRRALTRELSRVLVHAMQTETNASFLDIEIANLAEIKRRHGRAAADAVMTHVAGVLRQGVRASDVVGSLGDGDIGVILALTEGEAARDKAHELASAFAVHPFRWQGERLFLAVTWGFHAFVAGDTAASVIEGAERARRASDGRASAETDAGPPNT